MTTVGWSGAIAWFVYSLLHSSNKATAEARLIQMYLLSVVIADVILVVTGVAPITLYEHTTTTTTTSRVCIKCVDAGGEGGGDGI